MEYSAMRCDGICGHTAFFMYKTAKGALKFSAGNGMMIVALQTSCKNFSYNLRKRNGA